jgi:NAD(P)-dependent dehydrogenase (short-subunit alcohol dehydrogenase family)
MTAPQRVALVTGAGSGIGQATSRLLIRKGWRVALTDINEAAIRLLAKELGDGAIALPGDISDPKHVSEMAAAIEAQSGGRLDLLVNCAGVLYSGHFEDQPSESILRILAVNNAGMALCCHAAFPLLRQAAQKGGKPAVVNLSSASAAFGIPSLAVYSASKFFVRGFTEALASEWGRHGIAVRDVMPPFVDTPMARIACKGNPFHERLGSNLSADAVAREVYAAAMGGPLRRLVSLRLRAAMFAARLAPAASMRAGLRTLGGYPRRRDGASSEKQRS